MTNAMTQNRRMSKYFYPAHGYTYTSDDRKQLASYTPKPSDSKMAMTIMCPPANQEPPIFRLGFLMSHERVLQIAKEFGAGESPELRDLTVGKFLAAQEHVVVRIAEVAEIEEEDIPHLRFLPVLNSAGQRRYALTVGNSRQMSLATDDVERVAELFGLEMGDLKWHLCADRWHWRPKEGFALLPLRDLQKEEAKLMEAYAAGDERLLQHSPITWDSWWYA